MHGLDLATLALYVPAALVLALTPGPGIFYVAARTLAGGRAEGILSSLGTGLGGMVHVVAGALGLSAVIMTSATVFSALKWIGAAYLVWLGCRTLINSRKADAALPILAASNDHTAGWSKAFVEGIVVEALNPKTAAFFLAFIPQFIDPTVDSVALIFFWLGLIAVCLNTLVDCAVAVWASRIRSGALSHPHLITRLQQGSGALMIALGLGLAFAKQPKA